MGLIILNEDLSSGLEGNLVALGGSGTIQGLDAEIALSANRSSYPAVATIVSSASGNDLVVNARSLVMGTFETMTILGNITLNCTNLTLGDTVALQNLALNATSSIFLKTHGDVSLLNNIGGFYTSPSLYFLGGSGYSQTGTLIPSGAALNAGDIGLSTPVFLNLLFFTSHILNYDTTFQPNPPAPTPSGGGTVEIAPSPSIVRGDFYKLAIADAQLSDLLPIYPHYFPRPFKLIPHKKWRIRPK